MLHFTSSEAADRHVHYRPKVHDVAPDWRGVPVHLLAFSGALDIGYGTDDSVRPLAQIAAHVEGVDRSGRWSGPEAWVPSSH